MIGTSLGPYRILGLLGSGRTGEVYLAEDCRSTDDGATAGQDARRARRVAIKALRPELVGDATRIAWEQRARAATTLRHPHICMLYDIVAHEDRLFLVMESLAGKTLYRLMSGAPLPIKHLLKIAIQVADALGVAHERAVIHGNLSSTNIFITDAGDAKILGFWPAGLANEAPAGNRADVRSDVSALGAVLYEMATGRAPHARSAGAARSIERHGPDPMFSRDPAPGHEPAPGYGPPRAIEANSRLPTGLVRLIDAALQKDPADRVASVDEIKKQLEEIQRAPGSLDSILPAEHISSTAAVEPPPRPEQQAAGGADADPLVQPQLPLDEPPSSPPRADKPSN